MGGMMRSRISMLAAMAIGFHGWSAGGSSMQYPMHGYQTPNHGYRRKGKTAFQHRIAEMQLRKTAETTARNAARAYNGMGGK